MQQACANVFGLESRKGGYRPLLYMNVDRMGEYGICTGSISVSAIFLFIILIMRIDERNGNVCTVLFAVP